MIPRMTLRNRLAIQEQKELSWRMKPPKPPSANMERMKKKGCIVCGGAFHRICYNADGRRIAACEDHWRDVHVAHAELGTDDC